LLLHHCLDYLQEFTKEQVQPISLLRLELEHSEEFIDPFAQ
jgi:hypothetical protein